MPYPADNHRAFERQLNCFSEEDLAIVARQLILLSETKDHASMCDTLRKLEAFASGDNRMRIAAFLGILPFAKTLTEEDVPPSSIMVTAIWRHLLREAKRNDEPRIARTDPVHGIRYGRVHRVPTATRTHTSPAQRQRLDSNDYGDIGEGIFGFFGWVWRLIFDH